MSKIKIALAAINPIVGNINHNAELIIEARRAASEQGADLVVFGEFDFLAFQNFSVIP